MMAESNIDATVIKRTQETLGKYVKKPPLTEKLLKKPPFRFLYDVFNVVIKDTGCFQGLYTTDELTFENIKDRDDKMRFLQKMIDVVKLATNTSITVRTSKIVAGHEPEKTNELLQLMGEVIGKQLDWKSAVEQVVGGKAKPAETAKSKTQTKPKDNSTSKVKDKTREKPKDKEVKKKETKSNDTKGSSKTISPTTKDDKVKKAPLIKEKEKPASKGTKDKVRRESKDATAEKQKAAKSRTESKDKSLSPPKNEVRKERISPTEEVKVDENQNTVEIKKVATTKREANPPESAAPAANEIKAERRGSKRAEDKAEPLPAAAVVPPTIQAESGKDEFEHGKSSAQRKGSSGKSRRSSVTKATTNEQDNMQQSLSNLDSLKSVNEEFTPPASTVLLNQPAQPPEPQPQPPPQPQLPPQPHTELKRESTFIRENSKDNTAISANRPRTASLRPPSARPASARPGAPRRRDKNIEIILQPNDMVKMSGIDVKLETFGDFDDDGDNLVIIEDASADNVLGMHENTGSGGANAGDNLEQQGHLVQQILETQKELVQQNGQEQSNKNEKDTDPTAGINARQSSARQMNNLRDVIQNLTKSVNPFGKLMDFIPEDIDAMQLELTMWRDSYTQAASALKREKSLTESVTEPMKVQLVQIEANIKEYLEMNDASRTKILQNSEKIFKMLTEQ